MLMKKNNPACDTQDCCGCQCGGSALPTLYLTIDNVAMRYPAQECLSPYFGVTPDETWFNGVTFIFNFNWDTAQLMANNPNGFNDITNPYGLGNSANRCVGQFGWWGCVYAYGPPYDEVAMWGISVQLFLLGGKFTVAIQLYHREYAGSSSSTVEVWQQYTGACPTGSYTEIFRTALPGTGVGPFNFFGATFDLVWA